MKNNSNEIVVYWSPWWDVANETNMDMWYHDPINVYKDLMSIFHPPIVTKNYMQCPAVKNELESTYLFLNPADTEIVIKKEANKDITVNHKEVESTLIPCLLRHAPTLDNHDLFEYHLSYMFFAEESLPITMSSPYFHKTNYTNYGAIVPGTYDCGQWFRPLNIEIQLWSGNNFFRIEENEPLVYFRFNTDKKIVFKRFVATKKAWDISASMVRFKGQPKWYNLSSRYEKFHKSSMRDIILNEIKNNLLE